MKVNYTLPGLFQEASIESDASVEGQQEAFGAQLQRLRSPEITDWREILGLNAPSAAIAMLDPPSMPPGISLRDSVEQRSWWRGILHRHSRLLGQDVKNLGDTSDATVQEMLKSLLEFQSQEDQVFARHFSESEN